MAIIRSKFIIEKMKFSQTSYWCEPEYTINAEAFGKKRLVYWFSNLSDTLD